VRQPISSVPFCRAHARAFARHTPSAIHSNALMRKWFPRTLRRNRRTRPAVVPAPIVPRRFTMRLLAPAALLLLTTVPALAVQDQPTTINGVETVCTGVGSGKDDPRWSAYPVKIVIANTAGENVAAMQIALTANGKPVVQTTCDAPWILLKLPA